MWQLRISWQQKLGPVASDNQLRNIRPSPWLYFVCFAFCFPFVHLLFHYFNFILLFVRDSAWVHRCMLWSDLLCNAFVSCGNKPAMSQLQHAHLLTGWTDIKSSVCEISQPDDDPIFLPDRLMEFTSQRLSQSEVRSTSFVFAVEIQSYNTFTIVYLPRILDWLLFCFLLTSTLWSTVDWRLRYWVSELSPS